MSIVKYELDQNISLKEKREFIERAIQLSCDFWMENSTVVIRDDNWKDDLSFISRVISDNSSIEVSQVNEYSKELFYGSVRVKLNRADSNRLLNIHLSLYEFKEFVKQFKLEEIK